MVPLSAARRSFARTSLIFLWLTTGLLSLLGLQDRSLALLQNTAVPSDLRAATIVAGALIDLLLGLAMWRWHRRSVYACALSSMFVMTLLGSLLQPMLWLDPLGCMSKNLPIAALLLMLYEDARS